MFRSLSALALLLLFALPSVAMAQNTGKLAGTVTDDTGETIPGATVFLPEIQRGAATDMDGTYTILGIPVGTYEVQFSSVGYGSQSIEDVTISRDRTRQLDVTLTTGQELAEVVVEYERPIIQNDASVARVVSGEDIENLPVRGPSAVASLAAGVVSESGSNDLYVRGGRDEEVTYFVDGVKIVGGAANVGVPTQAIAEQEILVGTIPPQYGDVLSGVISISTLSGGNNFFGSLEANTSEGLDGFGSSLAALTLGGPILRDRASFLLSGSYEYQADNTPFAINSLRLRDEVYNDIQMNPQAVAFRNPSTGEISYATIPGNSAGAADEERILELVGTTGFDATGLELVNGGALVSRADLVTAESFEERRSKENPDRDIVLNGNLTFRPAPGSSIRLGGTYTDSEVETFSFARSWFNRDATNTSEDRSYRFYGTARQAVGSTTFLQLQGEFTQRDRLFYPTVWGGDIENTLFYGDIDDPVNAVAASYVNYNSAEETYAQAFNDGSLTIGTNYNLFTAPGRVRSTFQQRDDQQVRVFGSATTQIGPHQLDIGGEFERRTARAYTINAIGLARFFDDGNVEADTDTPVTSYDQRGEDGEFLLGPDYFIENAGYYGYDYLGLNEANDESLQGFADETNLNIAPYEPVYYGAYLRDKIEFSDLVLDIGFRLDAFDNNTTVLADPFALQDIYRVRDLANGDITTTSGSVINAPEGGFPSTVDDGDAIYVNGAGNVVGYRDVEGQYYDAEGRFVTSNVVTSAGTAVGENEVSADVFDTYETQFTFMPRVGVSFPVTDRALFFASYNVTSQRPTENAFATIQDYITANSGQSRINNSNLKPEKTTQYELGLRQRIGERAAITVSGFYRTQEDKIQLRNIRGAFPSEYTTFQNVDFSTIKGAEFGFELRRTNNVAINANYTLSFAEGTGSESTTTTIFAWRAPAGAEFPETITPLDFDSRHSLTASLDYRLAEGEGPMIGGVQPFGGFGVNLLGSFRSGGPYTPLAVAENITGGQANLGSVAAGAQVNDDNRPSIATLDLRVDRRFNLGPAALRAYVNVTNLLDSQNALSVYRATGEVDNDGYLATPRGQQEIAGFGPLGDTFAFQYQQYVASPVSQNSFRVGGLGGAGARLYGLPRQVRLGVIMDF